MAQMEKKQRKLAQRKLRSEQKVDRYGNNGWPPNSQKKWHQKHRDYCSAGLRIRDSSGAHGTRALWYFRSDGRTIIWVNSITGKISIEHNIRDESLRHLRASPPLRKHM